MAQMDRTRMESHDGAVEEIIDAGLGLDHDDLRLDRTTERWVVAGGSLRDRVVAILGHDAADVQQIGSTNGKSAVVRSLLDEFE